MEASNMASDTKSWSEVRRARGFEPSSVFVQDRLRTIAEKRGFTTTKVLTAWAEVVGSSLAEICEPDIITFNRGAMLGKLRILTTSARAAELQMHAPKIIERVNATHGFRAIDEIVIRKVSAKRLAKNPVPGPAPKNPEIERRATEFAEDAVCEVTDPDLRHHLSQLGKRIYSESS